MLSEQFNGFHPEYGPHAPREYQPPIPGLEHMISRTERLHTGAIFKHPVQDIETDQAWHAFDGADAYRRVYHPEIKRMAISDLTPIEPTLDHRYLHEEAHHNSRGRRPVVYGILGKHVVNDGHHRISREAIAGKTHVDVDYYDPGRQ